MTKKYVTTVTTEWEVRGNVTPEMINARIEAALHVLMMTEGEENYAFTGSDHILVTSTSEVPPSALPDEIRGRILGDLDFLKDFAENTFMGDGLEYDHARQLLADVSDEDLCEQYRAGGRDAGIIAELESLGKWHSEEGEN